MPYHEILQNLEDLRFNYPTKVQELEMCSSKLELESFYAVANGPHGEKGHKEVSRYATIRLVKAQVSSPKNVGHSQYYEDCVAERIWYASMSIGKIDQKTRRLIGKYGFLGAMIERLKPIDKVGAGNFPKLSQSKLADCSAEYCVWKWGRQNLDAKLLNRLDNLAHQYNF